MAISLKQYAFLLTESVGEKPNTTAAGTYTGQTITNGYNCPSGVNMTGNASGTNAGTYVATYTPDEDHEWSDGTRDTVTVTLTIARASVGAKPTAAITKNYNGSAQNNGYTTPTGVNMTGSNSGTNGGTYSATYTPDNNHCWSDNTYAAVTRVLTIQYVWVKWNVQVDYTDVSEDKYVPAGAMWTLLSGSWTKAVTNATSYVLDQNTGKFNISNPISSPQIITLNNNDQTIGYYSNNRICGVNNGDIDANYGVSVVYECLAAYSIYVSASKTAIKGDNHDDDNRGKCIQHTISSTRSKGSTNLGNVASTDINAYPQNAEQGGYWYVKSW